MSLSLLILASVLSVVKRYGLVSSEDFACRCCLARLFTRELVRVIQLAALTGHNRLRSLPVLVSTFKLRLPCLKLTSVVL